MEAVCVCAATTNFRGAESRVEMRYRMAKTGSNIYKRKDGRYEGRIFVGKNCCRKSQYIYVYARTLKEVRQKMEEAREQKQPDEETPEEAGILMKRAAEEWLKTMKKRWKPTTSGMYQSIIGHYIIPILGNYMVTEIEKEILEEFVETIERYSKKGSLSGRYKRYICSIVCQILDYAVSTYQLDRKGLSMPEFRIGKKIAQLPPEQDLETLKQYLLSHLSEDTCLGIFVAMNTGIRIGELCALQWGDFDLEKGNLIIRRNLQRIRTDEEPDDGKHKGRTQVCIQMPKTTSSIRIIPLADDLTDILRACRKSPEKYLISGRKRAWSEVRTLQYRFSAILKKCQIRPFHFHLLRHAFASRCVELGCDIKGLSEILGHSSVQITMNIYVHSSMKQKKDMMNLVCRLPEQVEVRMVTGRFDQSS